MKPLKELDLNGVGKKLEDGGRLPLIDPK